MMFMTQPAMSHALRRLRNVFDDELFIRTPKGMLPTDCANKLAPLISHGLAELQTTLEISMSFDPATAEHQFCVAVDEYGCLRVIPRLIERIRPIAPGVKIQAIDVGTKPDETKGSDRIINHYLDTGEIDLAIMFTHDHPPRFKEEFIYSEPAVCVISENNTLVGDKMDLQTYLDLGHIKLYLVSDENLTVVDKALEKLGCSRKVFMSLPHLGTALSAVANSNLVATVPLQVAKSFGPIAKLRFLEPPIELGASSIVTVWHRRWDKDPASVWLRKMIKESCADL